MLISVGILAWNEEDRIEKTLRSLFQQTALIDPSSVPGNSTWEIIVVPNGCTDGTVACARRTLEDLTSSSNRKSISWVVHEIHEAGKSNAWNEFVHHISSTDAALFVMLDADIEFGEPETIARSINSLLNDKYAVAVVDLPLKDAIRKTTRTLIETVSLRFSASSIAAPPSISGQFFCARSAALRDIWMPKGLSVEDGFLSAMIQTDCLRRPTDMRKIIRAERATHYYETLTSIRSILQHELRLILGTTLNCYLIWDCLFFATDPKGHGAGATIRHKMNENSDWYRSLIDNAIKNHGHWRLPRGMFYRRFHGLRNNKNPLRSLPIALLGFSIDLPLFLYANYLLKKRTIVGYW